MAKTVLELLRSDRGLANMAELMHARFGCPGKNFPCIKKYKTGVKVCEGCWINYFNTQVPEEGDTNETTKETYADPEENYEG